MVVHYLSLRIESQTIDENSSDLGNLDHQFQLQWHGSNHAERRVHRALQSDGASAGGRVFSLETDAGSILSVYSRAVEETNCSTTGSSGSFGFAGAGGVIGVELFASGGQATLDGAGHVTGIESFSVAGRITSDVAFTGAYKVNKNCSGTATVKVKGQPAVHLTLALVRQLQSIIFVETDANTVIAGWNRE